MAAGAAAAAAIPRINRPVMMRMGAGRVCPMIVQVTVPLLRLLLRRATTRLLPRLPMMRAARSVATVAAGDDEGEAGDATTKTATVGLRRVGNGAGALER